MFKKIIFIFVCLFFNFLLVNQTQAFSISPSRLLFTVKPGEELTAPLTVKNQDSLAKNYNFFVLGATQNNEGAPVFVQNLSEAEKWVKPEVEFVSIGAKKEKIINWSIKIPEGAYPGFYYLGLAVQTRNLENASIGLSGRLIAILSLQVAGEAQEILQIKSWLLENKQPWQFKAVLENKGNVDLPLKGKIIVSNWQKQNVASQEVYLGNNLLPRMKRSYDFNLKGLGSWSPWYWVNLQVNFGRTNQEAIKTSLVLNFSWWWLFLILVVVFIILWLLLKKKKNNL